MEERKICEIVKNALRELDIEVTIHSDTDMTALINKYSTIGAIFKTEIFVSKEEGGKGGIGFQLWYNTSGIEIDEKDLNKRLKEINSLPSFYHKDERWMRMGFAANKHHITVGVIIKFNEEGRITRKQVKERIEQALKVVEENWPLGAD